MKKASTKAKRDQKAKGPKAGLSSAALRDLELMNPAARPIKGGRSVRVKRRP